MSTPFPTEFFSKKRQRRDQTDALTALRGNVTDAGSDTQQADPVVDYECPRATSPMPNPTVLTAPRGNVPGFGDDAFDNSQLSAPSASAPPNQISDQLLFALEVAKHKPTFIYVAQPLVAAATAPLPPPPRSTTFAVPTAPLPPARRSIGTHRPYASPAPTPALSASPASDGSRASSDQLSDASTSSYARRIRQRNADRRHDPSFRLNPCTPGPNRATDFHASQPSTSWRPASRGKYLLPTYSPAAPGRTSRSDEAATERPGGRTAPQDVYPRQRTS